MDSPQVPYPAKEVPLMPLRPTATPDLKTWKQPTHGLTIIYDPPEAKVDIVLLHGLMGNAYRTWLHEETNIYWPKDLLPHDFVNARIMVFGYDVAVWHPWNQVSQGWLTGYASDLLGSLSGYRADISESRPLVFVAHSLGGLVVQQALLSARDSRERHHREIETHTIGICFLGTPHRGASLATWGERLARILNIFKPVNCQVVSLLGPRSKALYEMRRSFYNLLEKRKDDCARIRIVCFYETIPMVRSCVVSEESATIDGELSFPVFANHVEMVRFASQEDNGYKSIVREIHHMISSAGSSHLCPCCRQHCRQR
ncbi:putative ribonuclease p/mrp subunit [Aspergillus venezuelensis]